MDPVNVSPNGLWPWPLCQLCKGAVMLPLSDYGPVGGGIFFKAWACSSPACKFCLRIDKGEVGYGQRRGDEDAELRRSGRGTV